MLGKKCKCGASFDQPDPKCERCQLIWVVLTTQAMREAQREYFKTRAPEVLERSKQLESLVDRGIQRLTQTQPELF